MARRPPPPRADRPGPPPLPSFPPRLYCPARPLPSFPRKRESRGDLTRLRHYKAVPPDSRLRGNDGRGKAAPFGIPAYAGMTVAGAGRMTENWRKSPRKCLDPTRPAGLYCSLAKPPNLRREEIAMSLRNAVVALAFLMAFFAGGGGVSIGPSPGHPLGLFRLASLCPRRPDYGHSRVPG